jgi:hypothetical protein
MRKLSAQELEALRDGARGPDKMLEDARGDALAPRAAVVRLWRQRKERGDEE